MNLVPLPVAEVEGGRGLEDGRDRAPAVVDGERDGAVNHLEDQVVATALKTETYLLLRDNVSRQLGSKSFRGILR